MVAIRAGAREVPVLKAADVRFGSKADMAALTLDVRFTPNSGHSLHGAARLCPAGGFHLQFERRAGITIRVLRG